LLLTVAPVVPAQEEFRPPANAPVHDPSRLQEGSEPSPDGAALFASGVQAYADEKYDGAIALLEEATRAAPGNPEYHDWLGKAYGRKAERVIFFRAMGLARKARNEFQKSVDLDGRYVQGLSDLLDYCLEAPGFLGGGLDRAKVVAAQMAKASPAEGHHAEALIRVKEKDYDGARKEYQDAIDLDPAKVGYLLSLAAFLNERGDYAEADAVFDRAEKLSPQSPDYLFTRGQQLAISKRHPERARELLSAYLRSARKPDDPTPSEVESLLKKLQ
jgi:tetratricopeptide (TPR) repeat protein